MVLGYQEEWSVASREAEACEPGSSDQTSPGSQAALSPPVRTTLGTEDFRTTFPSPTVQPSKAPGVDK